MINDEIARISRVVIHPKFRGIGLGEFLVREILSRVDAKVVEVLAVLAKYNPSFEKAGMLRVEYRRDEDATVRKIRAFLSEHKFDDKLAQSKAYCQLFFDQLAEENKKTLLNLLSEFAKQPFIKTKIVTPPLISRIFSSGGVYLYWVNGEYAMPESGEDELMRFAKGYLQLGAPKR